MDKYMLTGIAVILTLAACERIKNDTKQDTIPEPDPGVFLQISGGFEYKYTDFDFYDSSACIFYFKKVHAELENLEGGVFVFLNNGDTIYIGSLWPPYMNSMPYGPFISTPPFFYQCYALKIENWYDVKPDPRNGSEMIEVLRSHGLLHSGLGISIDTVEITADGLDFTFTITNADSTDLLILDPEKTGSGLFHYFTNGLSLYTQDHTQVFSSNIESQAPIPWNSWSIDWLSELKSGDSMTFTIHYTPDAPLDPGEYQALFEFPGLVHAVARDQLFQGDARIWLGDVRAIKRILVP